MAVCAMWILELRFHLFIPHSEIRNLKTAIEVAPCPKHCFRAIIHEEVQNEEI